MLREETIKDLILTFYEKALDLDISGDALILLNLFELGENALLDLSRPLNLLNSELEFLSELKFS